MLTNVKYIDFRKAEKQYPQLKGTAKNFHSVYIDGTLFINTAFKGGEVEKIVYNSDSGEWKKL